MALSVILLMPRAEMAMRSVCNCILMTRAKVGLGIELAVTVR